MDTNYRYMYLYFSRRGRPRLVKFLDKRIEHKWIVDNTSEWYKGTVLSVKSGRDGVKGTCLNVMNFYVCK